MAPETFIAVITGRDVLGHAVVAILYILWIVMLMAIDATEYGKGGRIDVAVGTGVPAVAVHTGIDREVLAVMIEYRSIPRDSGGVALRTVGWKAS